MSREQTIPQSSGGVNERPETVKESCVLLKKGALFEPGPPALNLEKKEKDEQAAIAGYGDSK